MLQPVVGADSRPAEPGDPCALKPALPDPSKLTSCGGSASRDNNSDT